LGGLRILRFFTGEGVLKIDPGKPIQRSCKEVFPKICRDGSQTDGQNDHEGHGSYGRLKEAFMTTPVLRHTDF